MDSHEQQVKAWEKVVDVQVHFNELSLKVRGLAVAVLGAILTAGALSLKEHLAIKFSSLEVPAVFPILLIALITWAAFYLMDHLWYHRLLKGAVQQGLELESLLRERVPGIGLASAIGRNSVVRFRICGKKIEMHSDDRLVLFYGIGAVLILILMVLSLVVDVTAAGQPLKATKNVGRVAEIESVASDSGMSVSLDHPALFSTLEKTDVAIEGSSSPTRALYVFFDANCWYCHLTWKALQPYEKAGLQVRWVPVAYQKNSSTTKAAAIMQAQDRVAALRENETGYKVETYDGAIAPADFVSATLAAQFAKNTKLMQDFGAPGTPLLVWKDEKGKVRTKVGMPRLSQLPTITGLPKQKIDDPELADFR